MIRSPQREERESSFQERLEAKARALLRRSQNQKDKDIPQSTLLNQISLTLAQIERLREINKLQRENLLQIECYVDTELIQMEMRTPRYSPYRYPEREKLQRRLLDIEAERRHIAISLEDRLNPLHHHLLSLLTKHTYLDS